MRLLAGGRCGFEIERQRIDAMTRVLRRQPLALEEMAQMTAATGAKNLRAVSVGIGCTPYRTGNRIVEARPAASGIELVLRTVQRRAALAAAIRALLVEAAVTAREGHFGGFVDNYASFFGGQRFRGHGLSVYGFVHDEAQYEEYRFHTRFRSNIAPRSHAGTPLRRERRYRSRMPLPSYTVNSRPRRKTRRMSGVV